MARTPEQYADLARFAGLIADKSLYLYVLNGIGYCTLDEWQPDKNPAHIMLVLEALVKKQGDRNHNINWAITLDKLASHAQDDDDFNIGDAVCKAAEAVMEAEK